MYVYKHRGLVVKLRDSHPGHELAEQGRRGPYRKSGSNKFSRQCRTSGLFEFASTVLLQTTVTSLNRTTGHDTSAPSVTCLQLP